MTAALARVQELDQKLATAQAALTKMFGKLAGTGSKDRQAWVLTGAIALPDGTRVCLRHVETYGRGGDEAVTITMRSGAVVLWSPGAKRERRADILSFLDLAFATPK